MYCSISNASMLSWFLILSLSRTVSSSFRVEPKDITIVRGETAVFKCAVTSDVTTVYWYFSVGRDDGWLSVNYNTISTLDASKSDRYSIIGNKTKHEYFLQIRNVSAVDVADYKCFYYPAKQTGPNRTPEASLALLDPPKTPLCTINRPDTAIPSQTISMRCTSTGNPTPRIVWLRNGSPITGNKPRASVNTLYWNVTAGDSGAAFSCIVDYPRTSMPPSCKVTPLPVKPKVSVEPSVQTLVLNKTGKFVCESTGIPSPLKYKWYINGEVPARLMVKDVHFRIKHYGKTLKILRVIQVLDDAEVTCRVTGENPDITKDDLIHYGSARSYVSKTEIIPTVRVVTLDRNTTGTDRGGEYINGGNKQSNDFNDAEAKGELDEGSSSTGTVVGVVLSMIILLALVVVLAIFLYKRNSQINKSGKRLSAQFMQCVSIKSNSNDESNVKEGGTADKNDLYAKPMKSTKRSKQYVNENNENEELALSSKPVVLPRLVSKKKEKEISEDTFCAVMEFTDVDLSAESNTDSQEAASNEDEIIEIGNDGVEESSADADSKSESGSKTGSLLRSIYAKLPTARISSLMSDLRPKKPSRTFAESMNKLRTAIIPKRRNKEADKDSVEEEYSAVDVEDNVAVTAEDDVVTKQEVEVEKSEVEVDKSEVEVEMSEVKVEKTEVEVEKSEVEIQKSEVKVQEPEIEESEVAGESDDIPSSLPSEHTTFDKPVLRRNRNSAVDSLDGASSSRSDNPNTGKRSSLTLDNLLANVKRRSLSRRFSGFENRGSTPDLRISRRFDKNDIVHFVPLGKGNDMTGNVEVVKNRHSINFENEMSQTLLKSFHTVVPNQPQQISERIIDDSLVYENLDEKESCVSDCSPYMTDEFSDDDFDNEEAKPVERVAPMRIIDDSSIYENTELKDWNDTPSKTDSSANSVKFGSGKGASQSKPTMRVKPTPTPRSFRKLNGSNSSPESQKSEHYKKLPSDVRKKSTVCDSDIDPTTGESIYDNVDYKL